jgi:hypothetical protein
VPRTRGGRHRRIVTDRLLQEVTILLRQRPGAGDLRAHLSDPALHARDLRGPAVNVAARLCLATNSCNPRSAIPTIVPTVRELCIPRRRKGDSHLQAATTTKLVSKFERYR